MPIFHYVGDAIYRIVVVLVHVHEMVEVERPLGLKRWKLKRKDFIVHVVVAKSPLD